MRLHDLLRLLDGGLDAAALPNPEITGVRDDSRRVRPGDLFVARPGTNTDGSRFLADAAAKGAVAAVVGERCDAPIPQVVVADVKPAASVLANLLYGKPDQKVRVVGVTGTNGKTTTVSLLRHLLNKSSVKCGLVGTVEVDDGSAVREADMTTPGATDVAELLAAMRGNACRACAIEVSSHALEQGRVAGVDFAAGVFTNLTGDHLDYHGTMDAYAAAKAKLFASLAEGTVAAVNAASPYADVMTANTAARVVRFGLQAKFGYAQCHYWAGDMATTAAGTRFILHTPDGHAEVVTPLIGRHNVENILGAAAVAGEAFGLGVQQVAKGLKDAGGAAGRLQPVRRGQPFGVFVDYAHTDDGLQNVLRALRPLTKGRLKVLFGCGGDRDATKRPRMGQTAEALADDVYVTSDNPRTENPESIIEQILVGLTPAGRRSAVVEPDRRSAIRRIIADAAPKDVVLIAGKGHENYQIVGTTKRHFDDVEEAVAAIEAAGVS